MPQVTYPAGPFYEDAKMVPCPECYRACEWCSVYRFQVEEAGRCLSMVGPKCRLRGKKKLRDHCPMCNDTRQVQQERKLWRPAVQMEECK
ncbi:hypothetical protein LCGC14_3110650 [marine sediment metagenome]|uniref:Uncharacterized protein n=1 Tax=marine sediment metagenome TaxID=412755 RepID=A0A0F8W5A9_9ZZZZ